MLTDAAWLARCHWKLRVPPFGALHEVSYGGAPVAAMAYAPQGDPETWARTRGVWAKLRGETEFLRVLSNEPNVPLLLEYAAIDWRHKSPKIGRDKEAGAEVARQGLDVLHAFEVLNACVLEPERGLLARPRLFFDLEGEVRLAFEPASPGDVLDATRWPRLDERGLLWVVGTALVQLVRDRHIKSPILAGIISRCFARDASSGFDSLRQLRGVLAYASQQSVEPHVTVRDAWLQVEAGLGLMALGQRELALQRFQRAHDRDPSATVQRCIRAVGGQVPEFRRGYHRSTRKLVRPQPVPQLGGGDIAWGDAAERATRLEAERDFESAIALYHNVRPDPANELLVDLGLARCYLQLSRARRALEHATRVLDKDPEHVEAHAIRTRALLLDHRYGESLAAATAWVSRAPEAAAAVYARARAELGLGRMHDARASFARASAIAPNMLEAQLLAREVERRIANARAEAGAQPSIAIPDNCYEAFLAGDPADAIDELRRPQYEADPVAQLLLANCLAFEREFADAVAICERVAISSPERRRPARIVHARCLVELGRADEALTLLGAADDPEVCDARAFALDRLGRTQEAARELEKATAIAVRRSDVRVGSI